MFDRHPRRKPRLHPVLDLETEEFEFEQVPQVAKLSVVLADSHELKLEWPCDEIGVADACYLIEKLAQQLTIQHLDKVREWDREASEW